MKRKTKIICTLGPASSSERMIHLMAREGMSVARLNFSHGTHEYHQGLIDNIRKVNKTLKEKILIMQDLEGYRIRIGELDAPVTLKDGATVWIGTGVSRKRKRNILRFDSDFAPGAIKKGMHIFIADGSIDLLVTDATGDAVSTKVLNGGTVTSKKNVNIPGLKLHSNIFTQKDLRDLEFGIANKIDFVAQSFVRNKSDIARIVNAVKTRLPNCKIIAKIESLEALRNLDSILDACDGIIVARGDLGVSLPVYQVPIWQKKILLRSNLKKKIDITATQMLESMTEHPRPTRAEVNDVANAIIDGSGYVMLSGETAVGKFPDKAVAMMRQIIEYTEKEMKAPLASHWISPRR
ncbi:MAG: pyruvate kinase [Candidatus Omnitrophota bacterium]